MWKIRLTSFLVGLGVGGGFALYQLRSDIARSQEVLVTQAEVFREGIESRISVLEQAVLRKNEE